jgi:predicted HTH transcriptional regulator
MEALAMAYGALVFVVCGFLIGCACGAKWSKGKATETEYEIEYNTKDIGDEKVREYVCPTLPEELDTPENRMIASALASHDGLMTAMDIAKICGISTQKASALVRRLVACGYVSAFKKVIYGKGTMNAYKINFEKIYENT